MSATSAPAKLARHLRRLADELDPPAPHAPSWPPPDGPVYEAVRRWYTTDVLEARSKLRADADRSPRHRAMLDQLAAPMSTIVHGAGLDIADPLVVLTLLIGAEEGHRRGRLALGQLAYLAPDPPADWHSP